VLQRAVSGARDQDLRDHTGVKTQASFAERVDFPELRANVIADSAILVTRALTMDDQVEFVRVYLKSEVDFDLGVWTHEFEPGSGGKKSDCAFLLLFTKLLSPFFRQNRRDLGVIFEWRLRKSAPVLMFRWPIVAGCIDPARTAFGESPQ